jgi:hypothetical protein
MSKEFAKTKAGRTRGRSSPPQQVLARGPKRWNKDNECLKKKEAKEKEQRERDQAKRDSTEETEGLETSPNWRPDEESQKESDEERPGNKEPEDEESDDVHEDTETDKGKQGNARLVPAAKQPEQTESDEESEERRKIMKSKSKAKARDKSSGGGIDPFDVDFDEWYGPSTKDKERRHPWARANSWEGSQAAWARDTLPLPPSKVTLQELGYIHRPSEIWIPASIRLPEPETTAIVEGIDYRYKESATLVPIMCLFGRLEFGHKAIVAVNFPRSQYGSSAGYALVRWINVSMCQAFINTINKEKNQGTRIPPSHRTLRAKMSDHDIVIPLSIAKVSQGPVQGKPRYYGNIWLFPEDSALEEYPPLEA